MRERIKKCRPISVEEQMCYSCGEWKPADAFGRDGQNRSGLKGTCKDCICKQQKAIRHADPEKARRVQRLRHLKSKYGLTPDQEQELFDRQGGVCPICRRPLPTDVSRRALDHCHLTNQVRGILHPTCNTLLHYFEDPQKRARVESYLATDNVESE